jgi:hypothetical protein
MWFGRAGVRPHHHNNAVNLTNMDDYTQPISFQSWLKSRGETLWLEQALGPATGHPMFAQPMSEVSLGLCRRGAGLNSLGSTRRELAHLFWTTTLHPHLVRPVPPMPLMLPEWFATVLWEPTSLAGWGTALPENKELAERWRRQMDAMEGHVDAVADRLNEAIAAWNPTRALWNQVLRGGPRRWRDCQAILGVLTRAALLPPNLIAKKVTCITDCVEYERLSGWEAWLKWRRCQDQGVQDATAHLIPDEVLTRLIL